ncbi:MAG: protein kinase domain-containing protein [Akkermansiaceae bacterium]
MNKERYEIKGKIGQGGVGAVYKAFDTQLNREVAIKRVLAEEGSDAGSDATKSLLKEATALGALQHPHIVTIYDAGVDEEGPYVVMELINGRTLDEMVERGTLTWDDLFEVALQTQEALIAAQDLGLVHRDLKPSNVMVCWLASGKFQVKIVDFGLAKFSATPSLQTIDHGDAVFGSIFFMAPEQFERTPLDQRTDMYAMGSLYYYALTGQYPFNGETAAAVMASHLQHYVTPLSELRPDIPQWAADWVMWHIERNMDDRPVNARTALEQLLVASKQATQAVTVSTGPVQGSPKFNFNPEASSAITQVAAMAATKAVPTVESNNSSTAPVQITAPNNALNPHTQSQQTVLDNTGRQTLPTITATTHVSAQAVASPSNITANQGLASADQKMKLPSFFESLPKATKISILTGFILALIVIIFVVINLSSERKEIRAYDELIEQARSLEKNNSLQDGIKVTQLQLDTLLNSAASTAINNDRPIIRKILASCIGEGFDADSAIMKFVTSAEMPKNLREELFLVAGKRKDSTNIDQLIDYAKDNKDKNLTIAALKAVKELINSSNAEQYFVACLELINSTDDMDILNATEAVASKIIGESDSKESFNLPITKSYEAAIVDNEKYVLLRLLGSLATPQAGEILKELIQSEDSAITNAVISALAKWPNNDQIPTLVDFIAQTTNLSLRNNAFQAISDCTTSNGNGLTEGGSVHWKKLVLLAKSPGEKYKVIGCLSRYETKWSVALLEIYVNDSFAKVSNRAKATQQKVHQALSNNR